MRKKFLAQICKKGLRGCRKSIMARMRRVPAPGLDASCNPRAIRRSGCTPAEPYPPNRTGEDHPLEPKCTRESLEKCNLCPREKLLPMYRNFHIGWAARLPFFLFFGGAEHEDEFACESRPRRRKTKKPTGAGRDRAINGPPLRGLGLPSVRMRLASEGLPLF